HRAAIGLSEDTDAVAVVVSEETGIISLVEDGRIRRELDGKALKAALVATLAGTAVHRPAPRPGPRWTRAASERPVLTHLPPRAGSALLGVVLCSVTAGERTPARGLTPPLEPKNFPKDYELTGALLDSVEVRLRASPGIIHRLSGGDVSAQIDLAGTSEGE